MRTARRIGAALAVAAALLVAGLPTAASASPAGRPPASQGMRTAVTDATVYQCNWDFCNRGTVNGDLIDFCQTIGHFTGGSTGRWDLVLATNSDVVGFLPVSGGPNVPQCQDLTVSRGVNSATAYQCNWHFCNQGTVTGELAVLGSDIGHFADGSTSRWDLVLAKNSFVVGFLP